MLRLRPRFWLACALLCSATAGCAQRVAPGVRVISVHEYLFGAFGGSALDVRDVCPSGAVTAFEVRRNAGSYLASIASLGLYLPHQLHIRCAPGATP